MLLATTDLSDAHPAARHLEPILRSYGAPAFHGWVRTVHAPDDNSKVREALAEKSPGAVLVVDGGASTACALLGGNLAVLAAQSGYVGVIVNGCVRDTREFAETGIGVLARGTVPRKSDKRNLGAVDVPVSFGGLTFSPGAWVYVDEDGVLLSETPLHPSGV